MTDSWSQSGIDTAWDWGNVWNLSGTAGSASYTDAGEPGAHNAGLFGLTGNSSGGIYHRENASGISEGTMRDVRIYNTVLTDAEIEAIHQ